MYDECTEQEKEVTGCARSRAVYEDEEEAKSAHIASTMTPPNIAMTEQEQEIMISNLEMYVKQLEDQLAKREQVKKDQEADIAEMEEILAATQEHWKKSPCAHWPLED